MCGKCKVVNPPGRHVNFAVGDKLSCIHQQAGPLPVHDTADLRQVVAGAKNIRSAIDSYKADSFLPELAVMIIPA